MSSKWIRWFVVSAGCVFSATALAKFVSAAGESRILEAPDPFLGVPFDTLFLIVGGLEAATAGYCWFGRRLSAQTALIAWLATNFLMYRLGLFWTGYKAPCGCLGNLTEALHISTQTADSIMKVVLAYLLLGSYACLFWSWKAQNATRRDASVEQVAPAETAQL
jgi:hypothetical protein